MDACVENVTSETDFLLMPNNIDDKEVVEKKRRRGTVSKYYDEYSMKEDTLRITSHSIFNDPDTHHTVDGSTSCKH